MNKKNWLVSSIFISLAVFINACGEFQNASRDGTEFSTSTPLEKASFYHGLWIDQEHVEQLKVDAEKFCQMKKNEGQEENVFILKWLKVSEDGMLSFEDSENLYDGDRSDTARVDNEGNLKTNEKFTVMEEGRFKKDLKKCLEENKGMDRFYMSEKDFNQKLEKKDGTLTMNYVHTSYYCENDKKIEVDEIDATTIHYQKITEDEIEKIVEDHKDICN